MSVRAAYSGRAAAEVAEIIAYLDEHSPGGAQQFLAALGRAERQLSEFPNSGPPGLRPGTRRLVVDSYIVSYRRRGGDIEIFAVRHASRRDARL